MDLLLDTLQANKIQVRLFWLFAIAMDGGIYFLGIKNKLFAVFGQYPYNNFPNKYELIINIHLIQFDHSKM
jgi:hypothetical protein